MRNRRLSYHTVRVPALRKHTRRKGVEVEEVPRNHERLEENCRRQAAAEKGGGGGKGGVRHKNDPSFEGQRTSLMPRRVVRETEEVVDADVTEYGCQDD